MINFIPNDPLAQGFMPMRQQIPRANRAPHLAGFTFATPSPVQGLYSPGTTEFQFWQSREAALAALEAWESVHGELTTWGHDVTTPNSLPLLINAGPDLNAYYDRESISFHSHTAGGKITYSGESTDIVAHEVGHALLDVIRPEFWEHPLPEIAAFHEAFGDCMALITALSDPATRDHLLQQVPNLGSPNFVDSIGEDLADGHLQDPELGPTNNASAPRRALNAFAYRLPEHLPVGGPPNVLTSGSHSFSQIFTGCFYDLIRIIFSTSAQQNSSTLWKAAEVAAKLLIGAAQGAPEEVRFFQVIGSTMVKVDESLHHGVNKAAIDQAFANHNIALGSSAMLIPRDGLEGTAPALGAPGISGVLGATSSGKILSAATVKDIKRRMNIPSTSRLAVKAVRIGMKTVAAAVHQREVSLSKLGKEFTKVIAHAPYHVLVGMDAGLPALVRPLPDSYAIEKEVLVFVSSLLENGCLPMAISAAGGRTANRRGKSLPTHEIVVRGGRKVLQRVRFACRCRGGYAAR